MYVERMLELDEILPAIRRLHDRIRRRVFEATEQRSAEDLSRVVADQGGDLVFAIDQVSEAELLEFVTDELASREPIVLVAEGLPGGETVLPAGASQADCRWRIIVDPIDGTRCLMYQKRSGWVLTGVAPNRGEATGLQDIVLAVQTELPLLKQHLSDQMWAIRGSGAGAVRYNRLTGKSEPIELRPTTAESIQFGYAAITRLFPGTRDVLAAIDDEVVYKALGPQAASGTLTYEDQYPSTGGQIYSLLCGSDRFIGDLRPLMRGIAAERGETLVHCCHPYDICTMLIAEQLGVIITDPAGGPLEATLDVETNVAWVGYANDAIRRQVEPVLLDVLRKRRLIERSSNQQ
jgi:fructose-1,6-bisphosphatase/inositol monophosphatase family enzyme